MKRALLVAIPLAIVVAAYAVAAQLGRALYDPTEPSPFWWES